MEFLNIGGGEILVIILLAIILFGPEDILRIMRTVGNYVRKIQRMWAQVSAGLKGEFLPEEILPEEVRETIEETKASVDEVKATLDEVQDTVKTDIDDTKATVDEVKESLKDVDTTVKSDLSTIPQSLRKTARDAVKKKDTTSSENKPDPESVALITALLDDSSGSTGDEQVDETETATTEDTTAAKSDAEPETATLPPSGENADDDAYAKNAALIASMLKPKENNADGIVDAAPEPAGETTPETETPVAPETTGEIAPDPVEGTPASPSEPVTETPHAEEV